MQAKVDHFTVQNFVDGGGTMCGFEGFQDFSFLATPRADGGWDLQTEEKYRATVEKRLCEGFVTGVFGEGEKFYVYGVDSEGEIVAGTQGGDIVDARGLTWKDGGNYTVN